LGHGTQNSSPTAAVSPKVKEAKAMLLAEATKDAEGGGKIES